MSLSPPIGIVNLNKPPGMTSRQAVDCVARVVKPAKAGHAGTLDPIASGVLVVCVGAATRLIPYVQAMPKVYRAEFLLGRRSDTDDVTGQVIEVPGVEPVGREQIEQALPQFAGLIDQVPPQFSAVHVDGRRAYKLARRGETVDLQARTVEVHRIELLSFEFPRLELEIECGSGTYVRSIGRDLGELLGCGAVMSGLVRTRIGQFLLPLAVAPDELSKRNLREHLKSAVAAVPELRKFYCDDADVEAIRTGRAVHYRGDHDFADRQWVAILDRRGQLACLAEYDSGRDVLHPKQVFPGWLPNAENLP